MYIRLFTYSVINIAIRHISTHTKIDEIEKEKRKIGGMELFSFLDVYELAKGPFPGCAKDNIVT